jgi:hypothetical protein
MMRLDSSLFASDTFAPQFLLGLGDPEIVHCQFGPSGTIKNIVARREAIAR